MPQTLARKLAIRIAAIVVVLVVVGGAALWGLVGLRGHFTAAEDEYEQLRGVYEIGYYTATAQRLLRSPDGGGGAAAAVQLHQAMQRAESMLDDPLLSAHIDDARRADLRRLVDELRVAHDAVVDTEAAPADAPHPAINQALGRVATLVQRAKAQIIANREAATDRLHTTVTVIAAVTLLAAIGAVLVGVSQYRSVMRPLRRLEQGFAGVAQADFTQRVDVTGDREFARLAEQFNDMADRLDQLYRHLEEQVRLKSQQLVRSERLATLGHLAAGVAHEINNPLATISGYAESTLRRAESADGPDLDDATRKALRVITEEAFRCKDITAKLLSLSRPDAGEREPVPLRRVVDRVMAMIDGLPQAKDRDVSAHVPHADADDSTTVNANEAELIQVLLNLVVNALEAVEPGAGEVTVGLTPRNTWVELTVKDNGRGMTPEVLERVFEPFFTDKPRRDQRGTGLGLSITHAIVEKHGGRLTAQSDGPGAGSVFTVELPAARGAASPDSSNAEVRERV